MASRVQSNKIVGVQVQGLGTFFVSGAETKRSPANSASSLTGSLRLGVRRLSLLAGDYPLSASRLLPLLSSLLSPRRREQAFIEHQTRRLFERKAATVTWLEVTQATTVQALLGRA